MWKSHTVKYAFEPLVILDLFFIHREEEFEEYFQDMFLWLVT